MVRIRRRQLLQTAALVGATCGIPSLAGGQSRSEGQGMANELSADEIVQLLELQANATCGFVRVTFSSLIDVKPGALPAPFDAGRPIGSALYFLVTPGAPVRLHRIRNDQLYHYYLGDPIEVLLLHADGTHTFATVGPDLRAGQVVQLFIPGNTFHTAQIRGTRQWFLGASTEWTWRRGGGRRRARQR